MKLNQYTARTILFLSLLGLSMIFPFVLVGHSNNNIPFYPEARRDIAYSFSFANGFFSFDIQGNYTKANWTLYQHNLIKNTTLIFASDNFTNKTVLELENGVYTLVMNIDTNANVILYTSEYGISKKSIVAIIGIGFVCVSILVLELIILSKK